MKEWLGLTILRLTGWRMKGEVPKGDQYVLIACPHTSNWDGLFFWAFAAAFRVRLNWMGKAALFRAPFKGVMQRMGGVPIDRSRARNTVDAAIDRFREGEHFWLAVAPEGTRRAVDYWKSGFYHIARKAEVPIVLVFLDYAKKEGGFGPTIRPTGDPSADMDQIRAFYAEKRPCRPERRGRIRLRMEDRSGP